ncbi:iron regulated [Trifolium repens]|nr:iron regulated [Trifolium repens]
MYRRFGTAPVFFQHNVAPFKDSHAQLCGSDIHPLLFDVAIRRSSSCIAAITLSTQGRKMCCRPQTKGNDSPKVSEAEKNCKSTTYQQKNKVTSLDVAKHSQGSSVSSINSDSSFGTLMTTTLEWEGIPAYVIGIARGISAVIGIAATVVYPMLQHHISAIRTGLWSIWSQNLVPESDRLIVGGVQSSLQSFMDLLAYVMAIIISDPQAYVLEFANLKLIYPGCCQLKDREPTREVVHCLESAKRNNNM